MQFRQSILIKKNQASSTFLSILLIMCGCLFLWNCSPLKKLNDNEKYLKKNIIKLDTSISRNEKEELEELLETLYTQKANTYVLGVFPYKVWLYNLRSKKYESDTTNFQLQNRVVERPVKFDSLAMYETGKKMSNHLANAGFFDNKISYEVIESDKNKVKVKYEIETGQKYLIRKINYYVEDPRIKEIIQNYFNQSLLAPGKYYSNTIAATERNAVTQELKKRGYYHFNVENIRFELDTFQTDIGNISNVFWKKTLEETLFKHQTSKNNKTIQVNVFVNNNKDTTSFSTAQIGNVVVYMNMNDSMRMIDLYRRANSPIIHDTIQIIDGGNTYINHSLIIRKIFLKPHRQYSIEDYDRTMRHLNELGVFRFVRIRFTDYMDPQTGKTIVNAIILLSPNDKYELNTNLEFSGGDIYTFGTAAKVSVTNKNIFKGANQFTTTVSYGLELEDRDNTLKLFSQNIGVNASLLFPKFLLPIPQERFSPNTFPRTFLTAGINFMDRTNFFNLRSINASLNYQWNESLQKVWTVKPLFTNMLKLSDISETFQNRMDSIPSIRNAYQQTFVLGEGVEFVYTSSPAKKYSKLYLKLGFEESGLLLNAVNLINPIDKFSKYIRLDFESRYQTTHSFSTWAFRFHGGIGLPYGKDSQTLPYIKQYFVGGAYSIRGWRPRVLGPGSYYDPFSRDGSSNLFVDQAGDIKLELNAEYRFDMIMLFANAINVNGAFFVDAGNMWLAKKDAQMPNAEFNFYRLYQDIAISSGAGLRIIFGGFIVLRMDYAFPIKKPYEPYNYGWVIKDIELGSREWRRQNLNFNLAVGFPF